MNFQMSMFELQDYEFFLALSAYSYIHFFNPSISRYPRKKCHEEKCLRIIYYIFVPNFTVLTLIVRKFPKGQDGILNSDLTRV